MIRGRVPARRSQRGSAVVELAWLGAVLLVPLVYVIVTVASVQRSAYGVSEAARAAARAFVLSPDIASAHDRALAAARMALGDQGVDLPADGLTLTCEPTPASCLQPGSTVEVRLALQVPLPLAPRLFGQLAGSVSVRASQTDVVGTYRDPPEGG